MNKQLIIISLIISLTMLIVSGCKKPYTMIDDREKIKRTFERYIDLLADMKYDEAFDILYFGHVPNGGNKEMYCAAQKMLDTICDNIEYQPTPPSVKDNLAVMDIDMIFNYKEGKKGKNEAQLYFVKTGNQWKLVIGEYKIRIGILKIYPEFETKFQLKPDKSYIWNGESWDEVKRTEQKKTG